MTGFRMEAGIERGQPFHFTCDGEQVLAYPGESIAAALLAHGKRRFRTTAHSGGGRGLYCGMGVCWECVMVVNGQPSVRSCMTPAEPGMRVLTQRGHGPTDSP